MQRLSAAPGRARPTTWRPSCRRRARTACWSATARSAMREVVRRTCTKVELVEHGWPTRRPSSLVQLAHAQALREEFVNPWDLEPLYLRKPDAEINWATAGRRDEWPHAMPRDARRPARGDASRPCAAATCAACLRIEDQVVPAAWSLGLFMSELAQRTTRCYLVAEVGGTVVGYAGMLYRRPTTATSPRRRRPRVAAPQARHAAAAARAGRARRRRGASASRSRCGRATTARRPCTGGSASRPPAMRKRYYLETDEDALVMWAHDIDQPTYRARLAAIEARDPGSHDRSTTRCGT